MRATAVWSTDDVAPAGRAAWWRALMARQFDGLATDLYGDASCDARLAVDQASGVTLARLAATRHRVVQGRRLPAGADAQLKIVAPFEGEAWVEQQGRSAQARPGEWIVYDTGREYAVANPGTVDHLVVMVPRALLHGAEFALADLVARPLGGQGMARVALQAMRATQAELPAMRAGLAQAAGEMVAQLVRLSLLELAGRGAEGGPRAALRERIRGHVARHLDDPALSVASIATALRCSKRLLHDAFHGSDQTLAAYILAQRLEACARDLRDPQLRHWPVVQVAAARGFVNASHFSRTFRARLGMSPRAWRAQAGLA